ncbi:MAG: PEP-CTERM sorting domain-containing protein [Verrucomicrobiota bacterium]
MKIPSFPLLPLTLCLAPLAVRAASIDSATSGNWADTASWVGGVSPLTGVSDTANIQAGHTIIYTNAAPFAGLTGPASNDMGVGNGNTININGGVLSQSETGWWVRIGHGGAGTMNINDGRFHVTNGIGDAGNNADRLQVGVETNGSGIINIGNGVGAAGSAILNLRDRVDGSANTGAYNMNLGRSTDTTGTVIINSDGVLEGDTRTYTGATVVNNPHIRVGQASSTTQSLLRINSGGQFNARGNVEVGASGGAQGLLQITGANARMDMSHGELTLGYNGTGAMVVENGGVFSRTNTTEMRSDLFVGRGATGIGTVTIASGGAFRRESGGNVGDLRIGLDGRGTLNVEAGGLYHNEAGNWDWLGQNANSQGTVNVNGGTYEITSGANLNIGVNGTGVFRQTDGITNVSGVRLAVNNGSGTLDLQGGTFTARSHIYIGGDGTATTGTGSGAVTQSGGSMIVNGTLSIGIATGHTGTYSMTGGTLALTASDTSVGESGTGSLTIGAAATVTQTTTGQFFVGRNDGSSGTLIVDGQLSKSVSTAPIRVGNGNSAGTDNTNAPGILGGTGTITSLGGVQIGSFGTITGGLTTTVGDLNITGNLSFSTNGTLRANFDAASNVDTLNITGDVNITGSVFTAGWNTSAETGINSRYWIINNLGANPITGTFANSALTSPASSLFPTADGFLTSDGQEFAIFYGADLTTNTLTGGNDLLLAAVPEPSAAGLLLLAGLAVNRRRRRA